MTTRRRRRFTADACEGEPVGHLPQTGGGERIPGIDIDAARETHRRARGRADRVSRSSAPSAQLCGAPPNAEEFAAKTRRG